MATKTIRLLILGPVVAATVALGAGPALATGPPNGQDNPYAVSYFHGPGGACVDTYQAPPAAGEAAPGSSARGGNPGFVYKGSHGAGC
jgi:hypothetical protein